MDENINQVVLLLTALNLIEFSLDLLHLSLKGREVLLELLLLWQSFRPPFKFLSKGVTLLNLLVENCQRIELLLEFVFLFQQFFDTLMCESMLLPVFFKISIEVDSKIEVQLVLILEHMSLFPIKVSPIYVKEQIFGLIPYKRSLLMNPSVDLYLEVEFLIQGTVEITCPRIQNKSCEIAYNWLLFLL